MYPLRWCVWWVRRISFSALNSRVSKYHRRPHSATDSDGNCSKSNHLTNLISNLSHLLSSPSICPSIYLLSLCCLSPMSLSHRLKKQINIENSEFQRTELQTEAFLLLYSINYRLISVFVVLDFNRIEKDHDSHRTQKMLSTYRAKRTIWRSLRIGVRISQCAGAIPIVRHSYPVPSSIWKEKESNAPWDFR